MIKQPFSFRQNFYLIRHAQGVHQTDTTSWLTHTNSELPLTENGIKQAQQCAKFIHNILNPEKTIIFVSPYRRARETLSEIQKLSTFPIVQTDDLLIEQQFGLYTGLTTEQCFERYPEYAAKFEYETEKFGRYYAKPPKGESRADVADRTYAFLKNIQNAINPTIENIVIISHNITSRTIAQNLLNETPEWFDKRPETPNASVWKIAYQNGRFIDEGYIFTPHTPQHPTHTRKSPDHNHTR